MSDAPPPFFFVPSIFTPLDTRPSAGSKVAHSHSLIDCTIEEAAFISCDALRVSGKPGIFMSALLFCHNYPNSTLLP